jgi:hypothetical protein
MCKIVYSGITPLNLHKHFSRETNIGIKGRYSNVKGKLEMEEGCGRLVKLVRWPSTFTVLYISIYIYMYMYMVKKVNVYST